LLQSRIYLIP